MGETSVTDASAGGTVAPPPKHSDKMGDPTARNDAHKTTCLEKFGTIVESAMQKFFFRLGFLAGSRPKTMMLGCLVFVLIGFSGFAVFQEELRPEKLWAPSGTESISDLNKYDAYFPRREARSEKAIFSASQPQEGAAMLSAGTLEAVMGAFVAITQLEIQDQFDGRGTLMLEDLCVKDFNEGFDCFVSSVLSAWNFDLPTLEADSDPLGTVNDRFTDEELESFLGDVTRNSDGSVASAGALRLFFQLENNQETGKRDGEEDLNSEEWEDQFIDYLQAECPEGLRCDIQAARSLEDAFGDAIQGDLTLVSLSYLLIILYMVYQLSGLPLLRSRFNVAFSAVLVVGLSIGWSIGMGSALGFFYTPLHTLLPFILLGLGVDDAFVIVNAYSQTSVLESIPLRLGHALSHAGVSVTVTSLTDFVAFFVSSTSSLPALQSFCVHCSCGILGLFVLSCTLFVVLLGLDERRRFDKRLDVLCCVRRAGAKDPKDLKEGEYDLGDPRGSRVGRFIINYYAPQLTKKPVKALVILGFLALLTAGINGATKLRVEDPTDAFIPRDHYAWDYELAEDRYFSNTGTRFELITETFDYFAQQDGLAQVRTRFEGKESRSPYIRDPTTSDTFASWYDDFVVWATEDDNAAAATVNADGNTVLTNETEFYSLLHTYLDGDGKGYNSSVVFQSYDSILATKIASEYSSSINGNAMKKVDALKDSRNLAEDLEVEAFPFTIAYLEWESYAVLLQELYVGLSVSLIAVFVVTLILIAHPVTALLVFISVLFTIVDQLGVIYYWGLAIDNIAVINLVLAIGLSVDYSAHVGHSFMLKTGTRDERVVKTLGDIGVAVLNGGISTFLAVLLLSGSKSYVFVVFFKQFFTTVTVGLGHGLIFLPVLLSLVGPDAYQSAQNNLIEEESKHLASSLAGSGGRGGGSAAAVTEGEGEAGNPMAI